MGRMMKRRIGKKRTEKLERGKVPNVARPSYGEDV